MTFAEATYACTEIAQGGHLFYEFEWNRLFISRIIDEMVASGVHFAWVGYFWNPANYEWVNVNGDVMATEAAKFKYDDQFDQNSGHVALVLIIDGWLHPVETKKQQALNYICFA